MSERLLDLKAMLGFIVCTAKAKRGLDTDDETLREITETDAGETDIIINVADISYIFEAEETTVMQMISGAQIELTDTLDEIIQKIRRATAINVMAQ